jgi:hypothetical protein
MKKYGLVFSFLLLTIALPVLANIDTIDKWAWSAHVGWINFDPDDGGAVVYSDHLEGYVWGENVGWIRLGTYNGGDEHTYANATAADYGVNNDGVGNLSGYAWATNAGWINFAPDDGGIWIDPVTGNFQGYAWGENVGWIRFQNDSPAYKTKTGWRGRLTAVYQNDIAALITAWRDVPAISGGLTIADVDFLHDSGDGIILGHDDAAFANVADNVPTGVAKRWARIWQLDVNDNPTTDGGQVTLTFDISEAGGQGDFSASSVYFLLKRDTGSADDFAVVTVIDTVVSGDQLAFTVNVSELSSEFTLGADVGSPTAVSLQQIQAQPGVGTGVTAGFLLATLCLVFTAMVVMRPTRQT